MVGRYLSQIERGLRKPSADVLQQLAKVLSTSADTIYPRAGADRSSGPAGVVEAIRADDTLTDEQKDSLVQIYESFRATAAAAESAEARDGTRNRRPAREVD